MQWDEKELDTQFTPNVYFWTPNSEILAKALAAVRDCGFELVDHPPYSPDLAPRPD